MGDDSNKPAAPESSYVLAARDYADIAHLENPSVIERVFSRSRTEAIAYVGELLQSGVPKYILAGPKVAFTAMAVKALGDLWAEVSAWKKDGTFREDFAGRDSGRQTFVELLVEIDSNPIDADRLKAMKAMFLAANRVDATEKESILAYQLFQIAKAMKSGQLLLLKVCYESFRTGNFQRDQPVAGPTWSAKIANNVGHCLVALVEQDEKVLVDCGLISPRAYGAQVREVNGRLTDLGIKFCQNIELYQPATK
jgi:hypothetical protein